MEVGGVQRTDSQRSQTNNGPRVSFNKDVHVKRIGSRPSDSQNSYLNYNNSVENSSNHLANVRKEIPQDLTREEILKEAEFVLKQAERVKCTAEGGADIIGGRLNEKNRKRFEKRKAPLKLTVNNQFNSLPIRKGKSKPVTRSVSDVSGTKKIKRPSIFNLFSRKSEPNLDNLDKVNNTNTTSGGVVANATNVKTKRKLVGRSKSDVGQSKESQDLKKRIVRKRNNSENEEPVSLKKKTQLSPIIEVTQREDYFTENKKNNGTNNKNLAPPTNTIKEKISTLNKTQSKSVEDMHSSQLPPEKPTLTKGVTVEGLVKRLSMERFSPPPHFSSPAFSYIRSPNEQQQQPSNIIYAQVVCDDSGKNKQTVHSSFSLGNNNNNNSNNNSSPSSQQKKSIDQHDHIDTFTSHHQNQKFLEPNGNRARHSVSPHKNNHNNTFRNHSDEDEGLGYEIKRSLEDDTMIPTKEDEFKSLAEDSPIMPKIRDVPPEKQYKGHQYDVNHRGRADGMDAFLPEFQDLSHRRKILESRIQSRRIHGSRELLDEISPEREFYESPPTAHHHHQHHHPDEIPHHEKSRSPERIVMTMRQNREYSPSGGTQQYHRERTSRSRQKLIEDDSKYHKLNDRELKTRYSSQRDHLDMIATPTRDMTSPSRKEYPHHRSNHSTERGIRETMSEMKISSNGPPYPTSDYRQNERIRSSSPKEIDLGYIEDHRNYKYDHMEPDTYYFQQKYRQENEPKSLESQFSDVNRVSPEHSQIKIIESTVGHRPDKYVVNEVMQTNIEDYQNSLRRQKKHQRSFDKGDSGIENDYRGESRWKRRTFIDDMKACDLFLKKERRHTEETYMVPKRLINLYRERSIDDGSHFDPRLDKYQSNTLRKKSSSRGKSVERNDSMKNNVKKVSGLEKMKQLFTGTGKRKSKSDEKKDKEKEFASEKEMRTRYQEYRVDVPDSSRSINDISTRRRLSTPKASPVPKRTLSQKGPKSTISSGNDSTAQKSGWFKSIDRLSRKKQAVKKPSDSSNDEFFNGNSKISKSASSKISTTPASKNLRFFGDTDIESNQSISKSSSTRKTRPSVGYSPPSNAFQNSTKNISRSAYELDSLAHEDRHKSSSLQHLENGHGGRTNSKQSQRTRNLHNITENLSATENEISDRELRESSPISNMKLKQRNHKNLIAAKGTSPIVNSKVNINNNNNSSFDEDETDLPFEKKRHLFEESYRRAQQNQQQRSMSKSRDPSRERSPPFPQKPIIEHENIMLRREHDDYKKPPPGPPKPARTIDRRRGMSRDRERVQDSSGTEGDSSQLSQRSVVYLHATTVGEIPQPYILNARRRAASRDDLNSSTTGRAKKITPQTRTVSRSVSVLAPWTPKHLRDGYEINYSAQANDKDKTTNYSTVLRHENENRRINTLTRTKKDNGHHNQNANSTLSRSRKSYSKDEISSNKSSSVKGTHKYSHNSHGSSTLTRGGGSSASSKYDAPGPNEYHSDTLTRNHNVNKENKSGTGRRRWT